MGCPLSWGQPILLHAIGFSFTAVTLCEIIGEIERTMNNISSLLYLPPPKAYPGTASLLDNLKEFPPVHPLIIYSDYDYGFPGQIVLKGNPEVLKNATFPDGKPNKFAMNNLVFLTGLRIAAAQGLSHCLYLEADCRFGCLGWDDIIFNEYFSLPFPAIAAGTLAVYNPCNWNAAAARRWESLIARRNTLPDGTVRKNVPVATYGWVSAAQKHPSLVFPNGALTVMDLWWMRQIFDLEDTVKTACGIPPWDQFMGMQIWQRFEERSYDVLGFLETIYSGYGDVMTSLDERMQWLREGRYVAVHQIKQ